MIDIPSSLVMKVCLGYIQKRTADGKTEPITTDYVTNGLYEVDITGIRYTARVSLRSPTLPARFCSIYGDSYVATMHGARHA